MKFEIFGYDVKVEARRVSDKFSKEETAEFMNELLVALIYAKRYAIADGLNVSAMKYNDAKKDIYKILDAFGLYDEE